VIRDGSSPAQWRYVPSEDNPADHASRGLSVKQLLSKSEWVKGPQFLAHPEEVWPVENEDVKEDGCELLSAAVTINATKTEEETPAPESKNAVDKLIEHFSDWTRLRRAVAWLLRFKKVLRKSDERKCRQDDLTLDEILEAEKALIHYVQHLVFSKEISALTKTTEGTPTKSESRKKVVGKASSVGNLDPEYTDGLLRVGGRLRNALISEETKHPLILPKDSHVSDLIINHYHHKCHHQGRNHTLSELRQKYWILRAGVAIKKLLRRCVTCRKTQSRVNTQKMADLPSSRLKSDESPFTYTGMDFFGPFEIRQGRSTRKRYGVLFTCMVSRAVHIEVADSLDTSSCINAIRRFISRRGQVKEMTSDNGTNLVGANRELRRAIKELDEQVIKKFTSGHEIKWKFNPPAASHQGGVWERQIRTVRKILQSILQEQHLKSAQSDDQLHTLMCEIESTINSRPLTRMTDDPKDLNVITPNDILLMKSGTSIPPGEFHEKDLYARKRWRQIQYLANLFWRRWTKEYLPILQARQKWLQPQRNMKVGDVVMIVDELSPRNNWPMGIVEEVYVGNQGLVRSVKVKTKSSVLVRPINKLCLLLEQELSED
jgi:hypothetical protein